MGTSAEPVRLALRKLWSVHVIWTREDIGPRLPGHPTPDAAADRLLKNQEDRQRVARWPVVPRSWSA